MPTPDRALIMKLNELKEKLSKEKNPVEIAKLKAAIQQVQEALDELTKGN
jgi:hypothetical protein